MFMQNFIQLSSVIHELSWSQRKKINKALQSVCYRADSNNNTNTVHVKMEDIHMCNHTNMHHNGMLRYVIIP